MTTASNPSCPVCGYLMKYIPPGTDQKTGQWMEAFWACTQLSCGIQMAFEGFGR